MIDQKKAFWECVFKMCLAGCKITKHSPTLHDLSKVVNRICKRSEIPIHLTLSNKEIEDIASDCFEVSGSAHFKGASVELAGGGLFVGCSNASLKQLSLASKADNPYTGEVKKRAVRRARKLIKSLVDGDNLTAQRFSDVLPERDVLLLVNTNRNNVRPSPARLLPGAATLMVDGRISLKPIEYNNAYWVYRSKPQRENNQ